MQKSLALIVLCGTLGLAGCAVPGLGTVTPPPIVKTAPESALISTACRTELGGIPRGQDLLNSTDVSLGDWQAEGNAPADVASTLNAFQWSATKLGASNC